MKKTEFILFFLLLHKIVNMITIRQDCNDVDHFQPLSVIIREKITGADIDVLKIENCANLSLDFVDILTPFSRLHMVNMTNLTITGTLNVNIKELIIKDSNILGSFTLTTSAPGSLLLRNCVFQNYVSLQTFGPRHSKTYFKENKSTNTEIIENVFNKKPKIIVENRNAKISKNVFKMKEVSNVGTIVGATVVDITENRFEEVKPVKFATDTYITVEHEADVEKFFKIKNWQVRSLTNFGNSHYMHYGKL